MTPSWEGKSSGVIVPWTVTDMFCHGDLDLDSEWEIGLLKWELSISLQAVDEVEKSRGEEREINLLRWQLEVLLNAIDKMGAQKAVMWVSDRLDDGKGQRPKAAELKSEEEWANKESDMRVENCQLFEAFENFQLKQTIGYCLPFGVKAGCQGDRRFCERLGTLRNGVIPSIEKENQTGEEA
jgi:hypothetical protein